VKLSIVATLYKSAGSISEFCLRASEAARTLVGDDYEIILVNDGSPDDSLDRARALVDGDPHIVAVDLSRNFGHHKAMITGLAHAQGDRILLIDSDLEEDPAWLLPFAERMEESNADVVYGVQEYRKGSRSERWSGEIFYSLFRRITGLDLPRNIVTARLMTRRYTDALLLHREREVFLAGLWHITGFLQTPMIVKKLSLSHTTYTWPMKFNILVNSITSFSNAPLIFIFNVGIGISALSLLYIAYLVVNRVFLASPLSGWTSVMASIWLIGGLVISFIGILGIYVSKIFTETKQRPYSIVRGIYGRDEK
jgi:putative glycosyltransferase